VCVYVRVCVCMRYTFEWVCLSGAYVLMCEGRRRKVAGGDSLLGHYAYACAWLTLLHVLYEYDCMSKYVVCTVLRAAQCGRKGP
jgi:hypothetical protein